jgi:hypothetical protein
MARGAKAGQSRVPGQFIALPHSVVESAAYRSLGYAARSLLIDIAKQLKRHNNGSLVACTKYLGPLGWRSKETVQRCLKDLLDSKLLHLTRQGGINSASWYAVTWQSLDTIKGMDDSARSFQRSAFDDRFSRPTIKLVGNGAANVLPR